jgi:SAM-dependent methyltransferase
MSASSTTGQFRHYSQYYDLLYSGKEYNAESQFLAGLISKYRAGAKTILELGCGTGGHAEHIAGLGFDVHGVDLSETMLERAAQRRRRLSASVADRLAFSQGDMRQVRLSKTFDVVVSLFHVMSYQITNQDLLDALATAKAHLQPGGLFIFDCWYGPTVLTERPAPRTKQLENDAIAVTRYATPVMHANQNVVDVNYKVLVREKASGAENEILETHRMRYLFKPEVELLLAQTGFTLAESGEWLTGRVPGFDTWGVYFVAKL